MGVALLVGLGLVLIVWRPWTRLVRVPAPRVAGPAAPEDEATVYAGYAGSASCRECHAEAYVAWARSHHGLAERPLQTELDADAFVPAQTFTHGTQRSVAFQSNGVYQVSTPSLGGSNQVHAVERVIGVDPLRQFLVTAPRGRLQALEVAWDPTRREWFDVYGNEDRRPGEWGHWTGRGMTWNTMCATCHNTRLRKNYDAQNDHFDTRMVEMGVGCESCHGPGRAHAEYYRAHPQGGHPPSWPGGTNRVAAMETCGTCHSRRYELTGDFVPGDRYHDHQVLTIVDGSDIYHPDGQVRDENYEYGSFVGSRMHAAGVTCLDCHHPHLAKPILQGNLLCMRCHEGTYPNSPPIDPVAHSFHKPGSTGAQCVGCHMPLTTYMQRHPRHDHGFTIPDPLLTKELGIPNACNRCHEDKDTDWALAAVDQWYGERMERPARARARAVAAARRGEASGRSGMLQLLSGNDTPYWKAVAANLLDMWASEPEAHTALVGALSHSNALVRLNAANSLAPQAESGAASAAVRQALRPLLQDRARSVRYQTAWALRSEIDEASPAGREMLWALTYNADFPSGQMQLGAYALARTNQIKALVHYQKAVKWDPYSAPLRHELAIVLSMQGRMREAVAEMQAACRLNPGNGEYRFKLGLAWNELGEIEETIKALTEAVRLMPEHARAWYNLGLAYNHSGDPEAGLDALARGETANPSDPGLPYTRATLLMSMGRVEEAQAALMRSLDIDPGYGPARQMLGAIRLGRP